MLTYNDKAVENTFEVFEECKWALTKYWGFTVGAAFFNHDFGKGLTRAQPIKKVVDYIENESCWN